jgi:hypothetical protein
VIQRKGPVSPFTNIFTVYVNEPCDFSLADSTGYNICLRSSFEDTTSVLARSRVESMVAGNLATRGTAVYGSCDLLGTKSADMIVDNSYALFRRLVDSLHVDGILVIKLHHLQKEYYRAPAASAPIGSSGLALSIETTSELDNISFDCYLFEPGDLNNPVWTATLETKGASRLHELNRRMTHVLVKSLTDDGYIVH